MCACYNKKKPVSRVRSSRRLSRVGEGEDKLTRIRLNGRLNNGKKTIIIIIRLINKQKKVVVEDIKFSALKAGQ